MLFRAGFYSLLASAFIVVSALAAETQESCALSLAAQENALRATAAARVARVKGFFERRATGDVTANLVLADFIEEEIYAHEDVPGAPSAVRCIRRPQEATPRDYVEALIFWRASGLLPRTVRGVVAPVLALSYDGFPVLEVPVTFLSDDGEEDEFPLTDVSVTVTDRTPPWKLTEKARSRLAQLQTLHLRNPRNMGMVSVRHFAEALTGLREIEVDQTILSPQLIAVLPTTVKALGIRGRTPTTSEAVNSVANLIGAIHGQAFTRALELASEHFPALESLRLEYFQIYLRQQRFSFPALRELTLVETPFEELTARSGRRFFRSMPQVERLELDGVEPLVVESALHGLSMEPLQSLRLRKSALPEDGAPMLRRATRLRSVLLEEVNLRFGRTLAQLPSSLRSLELRNVMDRFVAAHPVTLEAALCRELGRMTDLEVLQVEIGQRGVPVNVSGTFLRGVNDRLRELRLSTRRDWNALEENLAAYLQRSRFLHTLAVGGIPGTGSFLASLPPSLEKLRLIYDLKDRRASSRHLAQLLEGGPRLPTVAPEDLGPYLEALRAALLSAGGRLRELTLAGLPMKAAIVDALPIGLWTLVFRPEGRITRSMEKALVNYLRQAEPRRLQLEDVAFTPALVDALSLKTTVVEMGRYDAEAPVVDFTTAEWQTAFGRNEGRLRFVELFNASRTEPGPIAPNPRVWVLPSDRR